MTPLSARVCAAFPAGLIWLLTAAAFPQAPGGQPTGEAPPRAEEPRAPLVRPILQKGPDGVVQCFDYYEQPPSPYEPLRGAVAVIALHDLGGSRLAYKSIGPALQRLGAHVFAVDLRSGKGRETEENITAIYHEKDLGRAAEPSEDYADITFAIQRARVLAPKARIVLLGTGRSAALALAYAALETQAGIVGVCAFSPAEGIQGWDCAEIAKKLAVPVAVFQGSDEADARAVEPFQRAIRPELMQASGVLPGGSAPAGIAALETADEALRAQRIAPIQKLLVAWSEDRSATESKKDERGAVREVPRDTPR